MLYNILMVAIGGAAGCVLRYIASKAVQEWAGGAFPWGTMAVNVAGCFAIGVLSELAGRGLVSSPATRLLLVTGFCGGFTTFSTFALENLNMARGGDVMAAALYAAASVFVGIMATYAGVAVAK